jgi:hypothetical protein
MCAEFPGSSFKNVKLKDRKKLAIEKILFISQYAFSSPLQELSKARCHQGNF